MLPEYASKYLAQPNSILHQDGVWQFLPTQEFMDRYCRNPGGVKQSGFRLHFNGNLAYVEWRQPTTPEAVTRAVDSRAMEPLQGVHIEMPHDKSYEPMPCQIYGAQRCVLGNTLLGDEMGLGKTLQALLAIKTLDVMNRNKNVFRCLIICPASLRFHWKDECRRVLGPGWTVKVVAGRKDYNLIPLGGGGSQVYIVGSSTISSQETIRTLAWNVLVIDEAHEFKNPKSKRTQSVMGVIDTRSFPGDKKHAGWINAQRKIYLTGTPMMNMPIEVYPMIATLWPNHFMSYHDFAVRYCGARKETFTKLILGELENGEKTAEYKVFSRWNMNPKIGKMSPEEQRKIYDNFRELYQDMVKCGMVRRKKAQVLTELPEKDYQVVKISPSPELRKLCEEEDKLLNSISGIRRARKKMEDADSALEQEEALHDLQRAFTKNFEKIMRQREVVGIEKARRLGETIRHMLETTDESLVVFAYHRAVIELLHELLKDFKPVKYYGGMTDADKRKAELDFQEGDSRVFIGNILAAGRGITLTKACKLIFVEQDWVPANMAQASDRIHRIGQSRKCTIYNYVVDDTLDAYIAEMSAHKREVMELVLDGKTSEDTQFRLDMREQRRAAAVRERYSTQSLDLDPQEMLAPRRIALKKALLYIDANDRNGKHGDGKGWAEPDKEIGGSLANSPNLLTDKQCEVGMKLASKYKRQLPDDLKLKVFG